MFWSLMGVKGLINLAPFTTIPAGFSDLCESRRLTKLLNYGIPYLMV